MFRILALISMLLNTSMVSLAQKDYTEAGNFETPTQEAEFPGGVAGFYKYLTTHIKYPQESVLKGIQGRVFIQFVVDTSGFILESSVKTLIGLNEQCNEEAERVIRECKHKWQPAKVRERVVSQKLVIPITFKLTDSDVTQEYLMKIITNPIKTIVTPRPTSSSRKDWEVFSNENLSSSSGHVQPGDSVEVIGCAPWLYLIKNKSTIGFISYTALKVTPELETLDKFITEQSASLEKQRELNNNIRIAKINSAWRDVLKPGPKESDGIFSVDLNTLSDSAVFLGLKASRKSILVGECSVIAISFYVGDHNRQRLKFYELPEQIGGWLRNDLQKDLCWSTSGNIQEIVGEPVLLGKNYFTEYTIYRASYCPATAEPIVFNPIALKMLKYANKLDTIGSPALFTSRPITIRVAPLPSFASPAKSDFYSLLGDYMLRDSVYEERIIVNKPISYSITITGNGFTFPLQAPSFSNENFSSTLQSYNFSDTIIQNVYYSKKTFNYSLLFTKEGRFDLSNIFKVSSFEPGSKKNVSLFSKREVSVGSSKLEPPIRSSTEFNHQDKFIVMDVSQSMMVEDYSPTRLAVTKEGINEFLSLQKNCDIGLIIFGGEAKMYNLKTSDSCYSAQLLEFVDFKMVKKGTAIGDALWLAINSIKENSTIKRVVILGDGDNTAGVVPLNIAISLAKKHNIKVFTIGIGKKGMVPFGKDYFGKPNLVNNTFSDYDFKKISVATGGEYYWAKNAQSIKDSLVEIFKN